MPTSPAGEIPAYARDLPEPWNAWTNAQWDEFWGDPQEALRRKQASDANMVIAGSKCTFDKYPDCWVAVFEGRVVATAPTSTEVYGEIKRLGIDRGITAVLDTFRGVRRQRA
ncbi:MAG: DUF5678 domain-containing protein [Dehalococcoidia bacterium]